ncbi:MAG: ABC transporter ATP-binding protein [Candidatus Curtissbacteria bacterium]|nr:ABC transporter ATP-binding protein [Candidatus Curtissbacteria bacterium]
MSSIIEVKSVSKKYRVAERQQYYSLRDSIAQIAKNPLSVFSSKREDEFWPLKNVSFNVGAGEVVGIIGKNGAGKSTLLKILSQITPPTKGKITLRGRTASLLEVGTGFHPELTGRENIFLNGSILGMTRLEIKSKFDEIVSFAEMEKFLDLPVKHYSSGMYTRLAFAVAAHLEPEILIVDEVLSVGDAAFQSKSLGKMQDVSKQGRTVLFVSHNLPAVINICRRVIYLKDGKIVADGNAEKIVSRYLEETRSNASLKKRVASRMFANNVVRLINVKALDKHNRLSNTFDIRKPITVEVEFEVLKNKQSFSANGDRWVGCNLQIINSEGLTIFNSAEDIDRKIRMKKSGKYKSRCVIPGNFLSEGVFSARVTVVDEESGKTREVDVPDAVVFDVVDPTEGNSVRGHSTGFYPGVVRPMLKWQRHSLND